MTTTTTKTETTWNEAPPSLQCFKLFPTAKLPTRATDGSVGYDVYANLISDTGKPRHLMLARNVSRSVETGLVVIPPPGFWIAIASRSGLALDHSIFITNAPGIIDPDYRGELKAILLNGGYEPYYVQHEDRIAQLILLPIHTPPIEEITSLDNTPRGSKGFGSSGR